MLKLKRERLITRIVGFCLIPPGYLILGICFAFASPLGIVGMLIAVTGVVMVVRSFVHVKFRGLDQRLEALSKAETRTTAPPPVSAPSPAPASAATHTDVKEEFLRRQLERAKAQQETAKTRFNPTRVTLYSEISGTGPYHSEEFLWIENTAENAYQVCHRLTSPMAFTLDDSYSFRTPIALADFLAGFYARMPYVHHIYDKDKATRLLSELQPTDTLFVKAEDQVALYESLLEAHLKEKRAAEYLDDVTYIREMKHTAADPWHQYDVLLEARGYGWDMMKDWADYMIGTDLQAVSQVAVGAMGAAERDVTASFMQSGRACKQTPELGYEAGMLSVAGMSQVLQAPLKMVWFNQTRVLRFFTPLDDENRMLKYVETAVRRTFGTENAMKLGKPIPAEPVRYEGTNVYIDSSAFREWKKENPSLSHFEASGALLLTEKCPTVYLFEDGVKTGEYTLQTEENEDFTGKYFLVTTCLSTNGSPAVPVMHMDGFISDTPEDRGMTTDDVGYRMEGRFLAYGGETSRQNREKNRGKDLVAKGLKYPGHTTPSNVRLVGVCADCGKSLCFHGYAFYMVQSDVAYSDDGLDCCEIQEYSIDKDTWSYEADGKTFRYYNSFNCPHCGAPYIDYRKYPDMKAFGVSGCVLLGRKHYQFK